VTFLDWFDTAKVSVIATAAIAGGTIWSGARQSARARAHERSMAAHARTQEQIESVYVDLMAFLHTVELIMARTKPTFSPQPDPPAWPDESERLLQARVSALASEEVRALLLKWEKPRTKFWLNAGLIDDLRETDESPREARKDLNAARKEASEVVNEIIVQVNTELRA
jgi:hypothetical protein